VRALEVIRELEPIKRNVYSGAVGYIGWKGDADTAIAIRTAVIQDGRLHVQAGAGIVYDSDPQKEWEETMNKGRALFRAVAGRRRGDSDVRRRAPGRPRNASISRIVAPTATVRMPLARPKSRLRGRRKRAFEPCRVRPAPGDATRARCRR
jgi:hypothetical protein